MSRFPEVGPDEAMTLWLAALAGDVELADQLRRLGLSDPGDSLEDAKGLSSAILDAVERARRSA